MLSQQERKHAPPSMLAKGAFATAALALSVWTALRTPEAKLSAPDRGAAVETSSAAATATPSISHPASASPVAAAQLAVLKAIEDRISALEQQQSEASAGAKESNESVSAAAFIDEPSRYVEFLSPEPAVVVKQGKDGAVFAINSDPGLTGKVIEIEVRRADGSVDTMTISVPKPDY